MFDTFVSLLGCILRAPQARDEQALFLSQELDHPSLEVVDQAKTSDLTGSHTGKSKYCQAKQ